MKMKIRTFWNVEFFYLTFTITDTIAAIDHDDAITLAANRICDYLDIDVDGCDVQTDDTGVPAWDEMDTDEYIETWRNLIEQGVDMSMGELLNQTHETQVGIWGFCSCEDGPKVYGDCPQENPQ